MSEPIFAGDEPVTEDIIQGMIHGWRLKELQRKQRKPPLVEPAAAPPAALPWRRRLYLLPILLPLAAVALLELHGCTASGAPVPQQKKPARAARQAVEGSWRLEWMGGSGTCTLLAGGSWTCDWQGSRWHGSWQVKDGVLIVQETITPQSPSWFSWRCTLDATGLGGPLSSGGTMALRPILGPKA